MTTAGKGEKGCVGVAVTQKGVGDAARRGAKRARIGDGGRVRPQRRPRCTGSSTLTQLPGDPKVGRYIVYIFISPPWLLGVQVFVCDAVYVVCVMLWQIARTLSAMTYIE